jgi:ribose 5-phosphate isomerase A
VKSTQDNVEGKRFAAEQAARLIQPGMVAGIGTGSTLAFLIGALGRRMRDENMTFIAVATSFQSRLACARLGIPLRDMQDAAHLDIAIDGADEVSPELDLIKGGGASHTREKVVAAMADEFVVIVDESKLVDRLGTSFPVPVEVVPSALSYVERRLRDLGGSPVLRTGTGKDGPVVTDNGQFVVDVRFDPATDLRQIDRAMHETPGIIETGLFFDLADKALVAGGGPGGPALKTLVKAR